MKTQTSLFALALVLASCDTSRPGPDDPVCETYVHRYGVEMAPREWVARGQHGQVVSKRKDGVSVSKSYTAGVLDGDTTYSFPHSDSVQSSETYSNGELVGESENYPSGVPLKRVTYDDPNHKTVTTWYENGTPQSKEVYEGDAVVQGEYFTVVGQLASKVDDGQGKRLNRDQFGQLVSHDAIVDGQMVSQTAFYPNGSPKAISAYDQGQVHGQVSTFFAGGEPNTIEEWNQGTQSGTTTVFQNGEKYAEVPYVNGIKDGVETRYANGDTVIEEITWKNGMMQGPSRTYVDGKAKTRWYYQDREVTKAGYDILIKPLP